MHDTIIFNCPGCPCRVAVNTGDPQEVGPAQCDNCDVQMEREIE